MVRRQIIMNGLNRDITVLQGPLAGILLVVRANQMAREPVIGTAVGIYPFFHILIPVTIHLARDLHSLDILKRNFGHIHVKAYMFGQTFLQY